VVSMPQETKEHYETKIGLFISWWKERGYPEGIPDEGNYKLEIAKRIPSWRRVCKTILRNDFWCKGLGFPPQKSSGYSAYLALMKRKKSEAKLQNASH